MIDFFLSLDIGIKQLKLVDIPLIIKKCVDCPIYDIVMLSFKALFNACISDDKSYFINIIQNNDDLLNSLFKGIEHDNSSIMKLCQNIFDSILHYISNEFQHKLIDIIIKKIHETKDTVIQIRYYDILFNISIKINSFFEKYNNIIIEIKNILQSSDDILFKVNLLELMKILMTSLESIKTLYSLGLYDYFINTAISKEDYPFKEFYQKPIADILIQTYINDEIDKIPELYNKLSSVLIDLFITCLLMSEGPDVLYYLGELSKTINKNKDFFNSIVEDKQIIKQICLLCYSTKYFIFILVIK